EASSLAPESLCGVWIDDGGQVHVSVATPEGGRSEKLARLRPFAWLDAPFTAEPDSGINVEPLAGEGVFRHLAHADSLAAYEKFLKGIRDANAIHADVIRPWGNQFLLQNRFRLFTNLSFAHLRRCQLDIETASTD